MPVGPHQGYALAYLLRLWRITDGDEQVWRASLQDVRTGERLGFPSLDDAVGYVRAQIGAQSNAAGKEAGRRGIRWGRSADS